MSKTRVDMAKVTQMLDAGWHVRIYKGPMGSYEVRAQHPSEKRMQESIDALRETKPHDFLRDSDMTAAEAAELMDLHDSEIMTDDFTPEQALTRMAYKVFGEII